MTDLIIRPLEENDQPWVRQFMVDHWAGETVVVHGEIIFPERLPGFACFFESNLAGLVTFRILKAECEIVSLDSLISNKGIGTRLIECVEEYCKTNSCHKLWLVTTNDNQHALEFYQKRGFVISAVHAGAVNEARKIKPAIPIAAENGIPIADEIFLAKAIP